MEFLASVHWTAACAGAVAAYVLGFAWYSPVLFQKKWLLGHGISMSDDTPMMPAMLVQALGTVLLALCVSMVLAAFSYGGVVLLALTIAVLIAAGGLFAQKNYYVIAVESGFVLAMVALIAIVHVLL